MKNGAAFIVSVVGIVALLLLGALMMGCVTTAAIDERAALKIEQWKKEHAGEALTQEIEKQKYKEALEEIKKEVAAQREAAVAAGAGAAGKIATGDIFGGIASLVGVIGLLFGGKKTEEAKT